MRQFVFSLLRGCLLLGFFSLSCNGLAQTLSVPPSGGFVLRQMQELERPPLPPGGLVPFRQGSYWGYADTTGRVWIEPVLEPEPPFFVGDVVQLSSSQLPQFRDPKKRHSSGEPYTLPQYQDYVFWLNARGEFLAVDARGKQPEAVLLLSDGRLRAGRAAEHVGAPALVMDYRHEAPQVQPVPRQASASMGPTPPKWSRPNNNYLGAGHWAYAPIIYHRKLVEHHATGSRKDRHGHRHITHQYRFFVRHSQSTLYALTDSTGRRLTGHVYIQIGRFAQGWALAWDNRLYQAAAGPSWARWPGFVLLNTKGRQVLLPDSTVWASDPAQGTVLVWTARRVWTGNSSKLVHGRGGIVDTSGRVLLPLTGHLSGPDELGMLRRAALVGKDSVTRYFTQRAEPALDGRVFRRGGAFYHGRAWVEAADGQQGLIDARGEWVTPLAYELVGMYPVRLQRRQREAWYRQTDLRPRPGYRHYENNQTPDSAYLVCRRGGKYGFLSRRTGREVIPARYDSVRYHLSDGLACLYRGGQPYLVDARGRELARGEYRGDWYDYPGRPLQLYRPAEGRWSVVDTSGRQRLPWLPGTGYLAPDGRGVVREPRLPAQPGLDWRQQEQPCSGVVDSRGRVLLTFREQAGYSGPLPALYMASRTGNEERWPLLQSAPGDGPGYYVVSEGKDVLRLLRGRDLQPLCSEIFSAQPPPNIEFGWGGLHLQPGGWHVGRRLADGRSVLISPTGQLRLPPPGTEWARLYYTHSDALPGVPFAHQVEKVLWGPVYCSPCAPSRQGYATPGGRRLWQE